MMKINDSLCLPLRRDEVIRKEAERNEEEKLVMDSAAGNKPDLR